MLRISLTDTEFQALANLLDAGVRATGLASVQSAFALLAKLDAAERLPDQPEAAKDGAAEADHPST